MGLEILESPSLEPNAGIFSLPAEFDRTKFAAQWVQKGHDVARKQQREHLIGTPNVTADGWTVWKQPGKNTPYIATTSKAEWILMCRPVEIQRNVNAAYGNVGKQRMIKEKLTSATAASEQQATGMLSDDRLTQAGYREHVDVSQEVVLNKVEMTPRVTTPPLEIETPPTT